MQIHHLGPKSLRNWNRSNVSRPTGFAKGVLIYLAVATVVVGSACMPARIAHAGEQPGDDAGPYHTPLAGEALHGVIMGKRVDIPARDRGNVTALMLGGVLYSPPQGDTSVTPLGALFVKRMWPSSRTRDVVSIFLNDLEYDRSFDHLELVTRLDTNTIPVAQREVVNNRAIDASQVIWGTAVASIGPGLRYKVAPFQVDNDLRLQLLAKLGYFYADKTDATAPNLVLPPDTSLYGVKLRFRFDGMRRNILELPHQGVAAGFDLDYTHRAHWSNFGALPNGLSRKSDTQNYVQFDGYITAVGGIPGLSERNRVRFSLHAGTTSRDSADRYNAIWIGGDPLPTESGDLSRIDYPGATYNQVLVSHYALADLQYRRELAFYLYLQLRETFIWADRGTVTGNSRFVFRSARGWASTIGLDSGFLWDSVLSVGFSWDTGFLRNGHPGGGLIVTWNKAL